MLHGVGINHSQSAYAGTGSHYVDKIYRSHHAGQWDYFFIDLQDVVKGLEGPAHHEEPGNLHQNCQADVEEIGLLQDQANLAQFREPADQKNDGEQEDEGSDEFFQCVWSCDFRDSVKNS